MICPKCGGWSEVLETRKSEFGMKRRRECANGHKFATFEIYSECLSPAKVRIKRFRQTIERRAHFWIRNAKILKELAAGVKGIDLAKKYNLTKSAISWIKTKYQ
jgi:transcriptional regulator NrdR family protein